VEYEAAIAGASRDPGAHVRQRFPIACTTHMPDKYRARYASPVPAVQLRPMIVLLTSRSRTTESDHVSDKPALPIRRVYRLDGVFRFKPMAFRRAAGSAGNPQRSFAVSIRHQRALIKFFPSS